MARFSVGGDEDGNDERSTNDRPFPKRPRLSNPIVYPHNKRTITTPAAATISNSRDRATTSAAATPQPSVEESEEQNSDESDTSWSDSSSGSEEDSETPNGSGTCRDSEGPNGPVSVTLADPDVLDCPICYEALCSPVYQCDNGHIACASCCTIMKNKCPSCCWPIGYNRCRAIEKVLDAVRITCRNMRHGCMETLSYSKKLAHEKTCSFAPCSCPHTGCDYVGTSKCLYAHFALKHSLSSKQFYFNSVISISMDNNQKHVFFQERSQRIIFILNRSMETLGSLVNVVCVAPTSEKRAFSYELTATVGDSSIKLKSLAEFIPKWTALPPTKRYLLVPSDFISASGHLKLELTISRNSALRI